jgi:hypothetical protein
MARAGEIGKNRDMKELQDHEQLRRNVIELSSSNGSKGRPRRPFNDHVNSRLRHFCHNIL